MGLPVLQHIGVVGPMKLRVGQLGSRGKKLSPATCLMLSFTYRCHIRYIALSDIFAVRPYLNSASSRDLVCEFRFLLGMRAILRAQSWYRGVKARKEFEHILRDYRIFIKTARAISCFTPPGLAATTASLASIYGQ